MLLVRSDSHLYYETAEFRWKCLSMPDMLSTQLRSHPAEPIISAQWAPDGSSLLCHTALRLLTAAGKSGAICHIAFPDMESRHNEHIHLQP